MYVSAREILQPLIAIQQLAYLLKSPSNKHRLSSWLSGWEEGQGFICRVAIGCEGDRTCTYPISMTQHRVHLNGESPLRGRY